MHQLSMRSCGHHRHGDHRRIQSFWHAIYQNPRMRHDDIVRIEFDGLLKRAFSIAGNGTARNDQGHHAEQRRCERDRILHCHPVTLSAHRSRPSPPDYAREPTTDCASGCERRQPLEDLFGFATALADDRDATRSYDRCQIKNGPGHASEEHALFCLEHVLRAEPRHTSSEQALGLPRPSEYQFHRDVDLLHALLAQSQVSGIMRQIRMPAHAERIDAFLDRRLADGRI